MGICSGDVGFAMDAWGTCFADAWEFGFVSLVTEAFCYERPMS